MNRLRYAALAGALLLTFVQAYNLVSRGGRGLSDVSVFYRTNLLLQDGVGPAIYPRQDAGTGWPISMPPIGFAIYGPLTHLGERGATIGWALLNLALLVVIAIALRRLVAEPSLSGLRAAYVWALVLLLCLAAGSIQVGQFSVIFTTCWLLGTMAIGRHALERGAVWLAIPSAIKIYPAVMLAVPLSFAPLSRRGMQTVFAFGSAVLVLWFAVPMVVYGRETLALNVSWWRGVILNHAQMEYLQSLRAVTNQSLDTVLLRYLSYDPSFHDSYGVPHASFDSWTVLRVADACRVGIVLISAAAVWRGLRLTMGRDTTPSPTVALAASALWCAALYLVLPETKSRYAVYTFVAFLPWMESTARGSTAPDRLRGALAIAATAILTIVFLPETAQAWGAGFLGPLALWIWNVSNVWTLGQRLHPMPDALAGEGCASGRAGRPGAG